METEFKVRQGEFEGPLELLLDLIERRKLHINDVSLSQVADDFISHTKSYEEFPLSDSADFILIASTLLLIKSKSLLPDLELTDEEQGNIEDLERRLTLYKRFKELSKRLTAMFGTPLYFADESSLVYEIFVPTTEITKASMLSSIRAVLATTPRTEILAKVIVQKVVSLEEMIESLIQRVNKNIKMSFRQFTEGREDKATMIVSFLAMLELVKQGIVRANQEAHLGEIHIEMERVNTPVYN